MKTLASAGCLVLLAMAVAGASEQPEAKVEGSYLLFQTDGYQRILSFEPSGNVSQVSDQQMIEGFTVGQGTWVQQEPGRVSAKIVDFTFSLEDGKPIGPSLIVFDLTFSDPVSGIFQNVSGAYRGKQFATGQNPLDPDTAASLEFGIDFTGQRISAE